MIELKMFRFHRIMIRKKHAHYGPFLHHWEPFETTFADGSAIKYLPRRREVRYRVEKLSRSHNQSHGESPFWQVSTNKQLPDQLRETAEDHNTYPEDSKS